MIDPGLTDQVVAIAVAAGQRIMEIYERDFRVQHKDDGSPLTTADRAAHSYIEAALADLLADVPVLSEESAAVSWDRRSRWQRFWLVDPLDGTREFVSRNGEFTVNIALVDSGRPLLGVVHSPALVRTHWASRGGGAWRRRGDGEAEPIHTRACPAEGAVLVASRSHAGDETRRLCEFLGARFPGLTTTSMGSALKICLVAEGAADLYPRLGPTSEWDTGAAHCVLEEAGGALVDLTGAALHYNKVSLLNDRFLAIGDTAVDWVGLVAEAGIGD